MAWALSLPLYEESKSLLGSAASLRAGKADAQVAHFARAKDEGDLSSFSTCSKLKPRCRIAVTPYIPFFFGVWWRGATLNLAIRTSCVSQERRAPWSRATGARVRSAVGSSESSFCSCTWYHISPPLPSISPTLSSTQCSSVAHTWVGVCVTA